MLRKQEGETEEAAIKSSESLPENGQVGKHERTSAHRRRIAHGKQGGGSH